MDTPEFFGKLLDVSEAVAWREAMRAIGKRVVFTNGCFDVLHAGHVEYLAWSRSQGDVLILGLNSDASVRNLKGERRPLVPFEDREKMLRALRSVDVVVEFGERTPEVLLERIRPDVHVKSAQYQDELPERTVHLRMEARFDCAARCGWLTDIISEILTRYAPER